MLKAQTVNEWSHSIKIWWVNRKEQYLWFQSSKTVCCCGVKCVLSNLFRHLTLSLVLLCRRGNYGQRWVSLMRIAWPVSPGIQMVNALSLVDREASSTSVWVFFTAQCPKIIFSSPTGHLYHALMGCTEANSLPCKDVFHAAGLIRYHLILS